MRSADIRYLRVSLLQACNFHCSYCRPRGRNALARVPLTSPDDFQRAIAYLHRLGIRKVRFTGGEPTLYRHLPDLVAYTKGLTPPVTVALTTNGWLLTQQASSLAMAGLDGVNISLDTVRPQRFRQIAGTDGLDQVIEGIDAATQYIPTVRLNCVLMRDVNSDETAEMIAFADARRIDIRFIEFMPSRGDSSRDERYISGREVRESLPYLLTAVKSDPADAARYYRSDHLDIFCGAMRIKLRDIRRRCRVRYDEDNGAEC